MRAAASPRPPYTLAGLLALLGLLVVLAGAGIGETAPTSAVLAVGPDGAGAAGRVGPAVPQAGTTAGPGLSRDTGRAPELTTESAWTGFAFDACRAPSRRVMDRWRTSSPFLGVGVYIGGVLRACGQPHLTRPWMRHQVRSGWKVLPIWVGPQASCTGFRHRISSAHGARGRYPAALAQGVRAARGARAAAVALGVPRGTTLWYDLEAFSASNRRCRASSLRFLTAWTRELHRGGYAAGVYSSINAAIRVLRDAPARAGYVAPDHVWFAWANHRADGWMANRYVHHSARWKQHHRVHQYALDVSVSYGGVRMRIDRNFVDLGHPRGVTRVPAPCGPAADRSRLPVLRAGDTGSPVTTAQCLLRFAGHARRTAEAAFGGTTRQALVSFQRARHLRATGRTDRPTWTALLATGSRPVVKRGSAGAPVRRLQRALNAALPSAVPVTGLFGGRTATAVRRYQARVGLAPSGVVAGGTWDALAHGRVTRPHVRHHAHRHVGHRHGGHRAHAGHHAHGRHGHAAKHGPHAKHGRHAKHHGHRRHDRRQASRHHHRR